MRGLMRSEAPGGAGTVESGDDGAIVARELRGMTASQAGGRRRFWLILSALLLVAILVVATVAGYLLHRRAGAVTYRTAAAVTGTVTETLGMTGNLEPATQTDLNFAVAGRVSAVDVAVGQGVTAGQTIATIDSTTLQDTLTEADATLDEAQQKLTADEDATNPNAETIQEDEDQVTIDQINVNQATADVQAATLTAPVSGVVDALTLAVGSEVSGSGSSATTSSSSGGSSGGSSSGSSSASSSGSSGGASSSSSSGSEVVIIPESGPLDVSGTVSDSQVGEVALGQGAEVTAAGATEAMPATVIAIAPSATVTSGVATFPVTVQVANPTAGLRPGTSADVSIITSRAVGVLTVPTSAVHTTASGTSTVDVLRDGRSEPVTVEIGASDATSTQITSGLTLGEQVVIATVTSQVPASGSETGGGLFGGGGGGRGGGRTGGGGGGGGRGAG